MNREAPFAEVEAWVEAVDSTDLDHMIAVVGGTMAVVATGLAAPAGEMVPVPERLGRERLFKAEA